MNQNLFVVFDYLKLWMIDEQTRAFALDATEHNQPLPGRNHLLDVMQIKPAAGERLAERMRATFLQHRLKNFASAEAHQSRLDDIAAQTNRDDGLFTRKSAKLPPIFVPPRIMREQIADGLEREPAQRENARPWNPAQFFQ